MSLEITLQAKDLEGLEEYYSKMRDRAQDMSGIREEWGKICRKHFDRVFRSSPAVEIGGKVYGDRYWRPLSPFYLSRNPHRRGGQIMIDTKRLWRATITENGENTYDFEDDLTFVYEVNVPYAQKQQDMRPFVFWHEELLDELAESALEFITEGEKEDRKNRESKRN